MRTALIRSSLVIVALAACADSVTSPHMKPRGAVSAARPVSIPVIQLRVTVSSTDALGGAYGIQNDGLGDYVDGVQNVEARLDASGTFAFNTWNATRKSTGATRSVKYGFDNPVDPANTYRPTPDNLHNYHFSTGPSQFSPFIPIQNLGINGNPVSECIYMGNSVANSATTWRVSFHKGNEDTSDGPSAFAVVTRASVTPAVWTITPVGSCSPNSNVAAVRSDDGSVLYGYYNIPFLFTLRAK